MLALSVFAGCSFASSSALATTFQYDSYYDSLMAAGLLLLDEDQNLGYSFVPTGTTPLPAALPLYAGGLGIIGLLAWRRKRKTAAAPAAV